MFLGKAGIYLSKLASIENASIIGVKGWGLEALGSIETWKSELVERIRYHLQRIICNLEERFISRLGQRSDL